MKFDECDPDRNAQAMVEEIARSVETTGGKADITLKTTAKFEAHALLNRCAHIGGDLVMKAYELYEADRIGLGLYDPAQDDRTRQTSSRTRNPGVTWQHLHRLKKIRRTRQAELEKKQELLPVIYGNSEFRDQKAELDLEKARMGHELEIAKLELERDKFSIEKEIEVAKISQEQKDQISNMAMRELERSSE